MPASELRIRLLLIWCGTAKTFGRFEHRSLLLFWHINRRGFCGRLTANGKDNCQCQQAGDYNSASALALLVTLVGVAGLSLAAGLTGARRLPNTTATSKRT